MGENEKVRNVDVVAHKITFDATRLLAEYWVYQQRRRACRAASPARRAGFGFPGETGDGPGGGGKRASGGAARADKGRRGRRRERRFLA